MTANEIADSVRTGKIDLLLDTNALWSIKRLRRLCNCVQRLNEARTADDRIQLYVSAASHAEKLFDLAQENRDRYDERLINQGLERMGLTIVAFDRAHAAATATLLGSTYPDRTAWHQAKRKQCMACLGIDENKLPVPVLGSGKGCGATIDWLIAGHAMAAGCILVTDDRGVEFRRVERRVKLGILEQALEQALDAATSAPSP